MSYRVALIIPCFNHADPLKGLLTKLADLNLPAYLVDDGSAPSEQEKINRLLPAFLSFVLFGDKKTAAKERPS